jgi:hypothetical protein
MPTLVRAARVLALATLLAVPASASGATLFRAKHPPVVVVVGQTVRVSGTVAAQPKAAASMRLRIVLSPTTRMADGVEVGATTLRKVAAHRARAAKVTISLALNTPPGAARLIACLRVGKAKERCAAFAKVAISASAASSAKIEAARAARLISNSRALRLLATSMRGGVLPVDYRGKKGLRDDSADRAFLSMWSRVGAADRRFMVPYFLPPDTVGSAWSKRAKRVRATARADDPCVLHAKYDAKGWTLVPAAGGKVLFHFDATDTPTDRASLTTAMTTIIYPISARFREPLSDGKVACAHGGTGALDVYVTTDFEDGGGGATATFPPTKADPCATKPQPVFIMISPKIGPVGLAHEFFHAIQGAYGYTKGCSGPAWFDEATAVWGEYLAYPGNSYTRIGRQLHPIRIIPQFLQTRAAWTFWYGLTKLHGGTPTMQAVLAGLEKAHVTDTPSTVHALDRAIPGGLRVGLEDWAILSWNHEPVGTAGFPVANTFAAWGIDSEKPWLPPAAQELTLGGLHSKTIKLDAGARVSGRVWGMSFGQRRYEDLDVKDGAIKELRWKNPYYAKPGADIQAYLHLADGTWRHEDWSARPTVTLCRTRASENVDRILLTTTAADIAGLRGLPGDVVDEVRARDICSFPQLFTGTWTRIITSTDPLRGSWTETLHGTSSYRRPAIIPLEAEQIFPIPYSLVSASVAWTMSGFVLDAGCTTSYSGSGIDTTSIIGSSDLWLQDVNPWWTSPVPEPQPYYYSVRSNGDAVVAPMYDLTTTGGPSCGPTTITHEPIVVDFLDVGVRKDFIALTPDLVPEVQKSSKTTLLAGHIVHTDPSFAGFSFDDTWSFTGTG